MTIALSEPRHPVEPGEGASEGARYLKAPFFDFKDVRGGNILDVR